MKRIYYVALIITSLMITTNSNAQSLKDLLTKDNIEKVVSTVTGKSTTTDITGTWQYTGSAISFESDNLLQKAGGAAAAGVAEEKLNEQLEKLGIKKGQMSFTFSADSTFTVQVGSRKLPGTYTFDNANQKINLKFAKLLGINATLKATSSSMDLLFNSDKLLKIIVYISGKSSNSTLKTISSLAESYDGMMLGFSLQKQTTTP